MGSRLVLPLPLLLLAALLASGAFWWLSSKDSGGRTAPPSANRVADGERVAGDGEAAALVRPDDRPEEDPEAELPRRAVERSEDIATLEDDAAADAESELRLSGRVVDELGRPVAGALVLATNQVMLPLDLDPASFEWARPRQTTTESDGTFVLSGHQPGAMRFGVRAPGYAPYERKDLSIPADVDFELDAITLMPGAILSGRVFDATGLPLSDAELRVVEETDGFMSFGSRTKPLATTGTDGGFRIDQIASGPWTLLVDHAEHPGETFEGVAERPGEEVAGLEFTLPPAARITGTVTDVPEGERGRLEVRAQREGEWFQPFRNPSAEVDRAGRFELVGLEQGQNYQLRVQSAARDGFRGVFGRSRSAATQAAAGARGVVIAYQPEGSLVFQVLDAETRAPIENFQVNAGVGWAETVRGEGGRPLLEHADGRVRVGDLRPGADERVRLELQATGYEAYGRDDIAVAVGQELDLGAIYLAPIPVVRVTVLDAGTRTPVVGARVELTPDAGDGQVSFERRIEISSEDGFHEEISGDSESGQTDENGLAVVSSLPGQTVRLTVTHPDHARFQAGGWVLPEEDSAERTVELTPGGSVLVTVIDAEGNSMPGASVERKPPGGEGAGQPLMFMAHGAQKQVTDGEGKARFDNLEPGEHGFRLSTGGPQGGFFGGGDMVVFAGDQDASDDWSSAVVVEGETTEITLQAAPRGSLAGVVREAGEALVGATLRLEKERPEGEEEPHMALFGGGGERAKSDGRGRYDFSDVEEGRYWLTVEHATRRMPQRFTVEVEGGENRFDVDLGVSILEGRITGVDGEPLAGVEVGVERAREGGAPATRAFAITMVSDGGDVAMSSAGPGGAESVRTDEEGRYRLRGVSADVELVVTAEGDRVQPAKSEPVTVRPDETKGNVDLEMQLGGAVQVELLEADGAPGRFCLVTATYQGDDATPEPKTEFAQSGSVTLRGLRPGRWLVNARKMGPSSSNGAPIEREVLVEAGETAEQTLQFE